LTKLPDIIDTAVAGAVNFNNVNILTDIDGYTAIASQTRLGCRAFGLQAIEGFGQNSRHGGLANAACAAKQIGMGHTVGLDGVFQCLRNGILTHDIVEGLGTIPSG
jgi:hypothetical protein